ncbi:MAG: cytochrome c [Candidatus Eremiobacteraeota bacterium]|nr:cytochrome c [Candidatus Eremiobacteraeota bacterium]
MRAFVIGIVFTLAVAAIAVVIVVQNGWIDPRADDGYLPMEKWASRAVPRAIRNDSKGLNPPIQATPENLTAGAKLYGTECAICHGASDAQESDIAKGLYVKPPQLAKDGVEDDPPGETYYKIAHGYRMTPMPAFSKQLTESQMWQLALFLKNMDKLPPQADAAFKKIPSQATPSAPPAVVPSATPAPQMTT